MRRTLDRTRALNMNDIEVLQKENLELQTKIDKLEERFAIGQINREIFEKYSNKYKLQQAPIQEELDKHAIPKSNHEELINGSIETLCNLVNIWKKADFETKGNFIKAIYPEGIVLDTENNQYLKLTI
jgi:hypothetical protein